MAICDLTKKTKAKRGEQNLNRTFIGYKQEQKISWGELADACEESRQALQYRFNNGLLTIWEWKILLTEVGMPAEEFLEVLRYEKR